MTHAMGPVIEQVFDGGLIALLTFLFTWLGLSWRMEKKYRTISAAARCMAAREANERLIEEKLERMRRRLIFGNMLLLRLSRELKISDEELKQMRSAAEIDMRKED